MSTSQFENPASATGIEWASLKENLLLIDVHDLAKDITTTFGITDAIRADITIIDGPDIGTTYTDTLIFPRALKAQLASKIGKKVLGRLGQGQAKPGQNPPWLLSAPTPADQATATAYLISGPAPVEDVI